MRRRRGKQRELHPKTKRKRERELRERRVRAVRALAYEAMWRINWSPQFTPYRVIRMLGESTA